MRSADPTPAEATFWSVLSRSIPALQDWYHKDSDGLWMIVSHDFVERGAIVKTLRLDYDGRNLLGGWSPGFLNWDDGIRAGECVDTSPPDGLTATTSDPAAAAEVALTWFEGHITRHS